MSDSVVARGHGVTAAIIGMDRAEVTESWRRVCEAASVNFDATLPIVLAWWMERRRKDACEIPRHPSGDETTKKFRGKL